MTRQLTPVGLPSLLLAVLCLCTVCPVALAQPLRIGVAGDYPDGLDGVLNDHGLPHERLFPWELSELKALQRYQVLLLSCPVATRGSLNEALRPWLQAGGRLYVETWAGMQGAYPLPELVDPRGTVPLETDALLTNASHPILKGLNPARSLNLFHLQGTFLHPRQDDQATVLARFCPDGGGTPYATGEAIFVQTVGQGEVVYSGAPLSFTCFHRGPTTEPLLMNIVSRLSQGRAVPRLTVTGDAAAAQAGLPQAAPVPAAVSAGSPPTGFTVVEEAAEGPYNLYLTTAQAARQGATTVVLDATYTRDHQPRRALLWLRLSRSQLQLFSGKTAGGTPLATASWKPGTALVVKRRAGSLAVIGGERELLRARTSLPATGLIAYHSGEVALRAVRYQPFEAPAFGDDFMREPGDPSPWTELSGTWRLIGLGNEKQSVNGFWNRGEGAPQALTTVGETWWEAYTAAVAVRLENARQAGLAVLCQPDGSCVALLAQARPEPAVRLIRMQGKQETVLASRPASLTPGQWYRLTLRLGEGQIVGLLDGQPVLQGALPVGAGGGVGLLVREGVARFDDVQVQPATEPLLPPRREGTPSVELPASLGPQDSLTWASPTAAWSADPQQPSRLWHTGDFGPGVYGTLRLGVVNAPATRTLLLAPAVTSPEVQRLTVTVTQTPGGKNLMLTVRAPGRAPQTWSLPTGRDDRLALVRRGEVAGVSWNGRELARLTGTGSLRRMGVELAGPPLEASALSVRGIGVRDYVFGVAPTDWQVSAGTWEVASRWACDKRWSWFAGWGNGEFAVWNKHPVEGDVVVDYFVGLKMEAPGGNEAYRGRDLNTTLCGDGKTPRSGYSFIMGGDGGVKTQLLRSGVVVAETPEMRVPGGYGVHHEWFRVRASRVGSRITLEFEGRPVLSYDDPQPLPGGYVGLWSRDSGILIPRVTIYR